MKSKKWMIGLGAILLLGIVVLAAVLMGGKSDAKALEEQLALGSRYMEEMDYEKAVAAYQEALKIDPKCETAYIGLAEVYAAQGDYESALQILETGYQETASEKIAAKRTEMEAAKAALGGGAQGEDGKGAGQEAPEDDKEESPAVTGMHKVLDAVYDEANPYSEGFAVVGQENDGVMKYNYIDMDGNLLLEEWVDIAFPFSDGLACVGYVTQTDEEYTYGETYYLYGYVDTAGNMVIPAEYLGTANRHPLCFYQGYAEVIYYVLRENEYGGYISYNQYYNVIDKQGKKQYDFDALALDPWGYGGVDEYRILTLHWEPSSWNYYYFYSPWMIARVDGIVLDSWMIAVGDEGKPGNMLVADDDRYYLVSPDNVILKSLEASSCNVINERYFSVSIRDPETGENTEYIADADLNLLQEGNFYLGDSWLSRPVLIKSTSRQDDYDYGYDYQFYDMDLQPISEVYDYLTSAWSGHKYLVHNEEKGWQMLGEDLEVEKSLEGDFDWMSSLENYQSERYWLEGVKNVVGEDGYTSSSVVTLFDEDGNFLRQETNLNSAVFSVISDELLVSNVNGENSLLLDAQGREILEFPTSGVYLASTNEDLGYGLYSSNNGTYHYYDLIQGDSGWELVDLGEDSQYWTYSQYWEAYEGNSGDAAESEEVLAENEESRILGNYDWMEVEDMDPVSLVTADGSAVAKERALSLLEDGLYLAGTRIVQNEETWEVEVLDMYLQNEEKSLDGTVYEKLGQLSQDRIAFMENGKWGYMELERAQ